MPPGTWSSPKHQTLIFYSHEENDLQLFYFLFNSLNYMQNSELIWLLSVTVFSRQLCKYSTARDSIEGFNTYYTEVFQNSIHATAEEQWVI